MTHVHVTYRVLILLAACLLMTFQLQGQAADLGDIHFPQQFGQFFRGVAA